jgi:hypothetical protein
MYANLWSRPERRNFNASVLTVDSLDIVNNIRHDPDLISPIRLPQPVVHTYPNSYQPESWLDNPPGSSPEVQQWGSYFDTNEHNVETKAVTLSLAFASPFRYSKELG